MRIFLTAAALLVSGAAIAQSQDTSTQPAGRNSPMSQTQMAPGTTSSTATGTLDQSTTGQPATGSMGSSGSTMGSTDTSMGSTGTTGTTSGYSSSTTTATGTATGVGGPETPTVTSDYPLCRSKSQDRCRQVNDARRATNVYRGGSTRR
jgi:hypothetical protein